MRTSPRTIKAQQWRAHWRTRIAVYEPPLQFADEQLRGPYTYRYHLHGFEAEGDGTRLAGRVQYVLPHWLPEPAEHKLHDRFVAPALEGIFNYRAAVFEQLFGADRRRSIQWDDLS